MKIKLLLFAHLKEIVGASELHLEFDGECTGNEIVARLEHSHPEITSQKEHLKMSVNGAYADLKATIPPDSEVAVFPPVSGG